MYMYFRSKEITISCCKVSVNITVQSYRYLNERSGCLQYTCTHICNTGIFFSSHHPNSIYTFLKPDEVQSIFPLGRMEKNCFICGKIISCCQKVLSSHIKHKIFHDFFIKRSNRIEFPIFTKSRFTSRVFIFTYIAHKNFNFCLYQLFI